MLNWLHGTGSSDLNGIIQVFGVHVFTELGLNEVKSEFVLASSMEVFRDLLSLMQKKSKYYGHFMIGWVGSNLSVLLCTLPDMTAEWGTTFGLSAEWRLLQPVTCRHLTSLVVVTSSGVGME